MMNVRIIVAIAVFSFFSTTILAEDKHADGAGHNPHSSGGHDMGSSHTMGSPHSMPQGGEGSSMAAMPKDFPKVPEGPVLNGKVTEVINGGGYSYLNLEADGQKVWIAGIQVDAKVGDIVSYIENVSMEGFTSRSLNKTFDKIIFASSVSVLP